MRPPRILYLYDIPDWAIHNVGRLWLGHPDLSVAYKAYSDLTDEEFDVYDLVWFGFSNLYFDWISRSRPLIHRRKVVVSVHDPAEIGPERPDWRRFATAVGRDRIHPLSWYSLTRLRLLKGAALAVTASDEMFRILQWADVHTAVIPTMSQLPVRETIGLITKAAVSCATARFFLI